MNNISNLSTSLTNTLKDSDLQGITTEFSEVFLDTFLAEGVLKEIPLVSTIIGIGKAGVKINEMMFIKKILYFISQVNEVPVEEREKTISEIDDSKNYRIKIGEKLLYIIDKCDDHEKSEITGKLFTAFLNHSIDYDDFLKGCLVIEKCIVKDLIWFIKSDTNSYVMKDSESAEFFNWGLLEFAPLGLKIEEKKRSSSKNNYEITNKDLKLKLSSSGEILRTHLKGYTIDKLKELKITQMNLEDIKNHLFIVAKGFQKVRKYEKLHVEILEILYEICNNTVLNDVEFKSIFTDVMNIIGKHSIFYVTREVKRASEIVLKTGKDFNLEIWTKFSTEFIKEHDLKDFRASQGLV